MLTTLGTPLQTSVQCEKSTKELIISYGRGDIVKFCLTDITFKDVFYIPTLVNNLYNVGRRGWDISMKLSGETPFIVNQKIITYADKVQEEYVIRFMDPMPKLYALANPTKDPTTWYGRVANLGYKSFLQTSGYVQGMEEVTVPGPDDILYRS